MKSEIVEVIKTIQNIVSLKGFDGALDEKGEKVKIGLRRETDKNFWQKNFRLMDGFSVRFEGLNFYIFYEATVLLEELHKPTFENEILQIIQNIARFIKEEYKKTTSKTLNLKMIDEMKMNINSMSTQRNWIECLCKYQINGIDDVSEPGQIRDKNRIDENIQNFVKQLKNGKF